MRAPASQVALSNESERPRPPRLGDWPTFSERCDRLRGSPSSHSEARSSHYRRAAARGNCSTSRAAKTRRRLAEVPHPRLGGRPPRSSSSSPPPAPPPTARRDAQGRTSPRSDVPAAPPARHPDSPRPPARPPRQRLLELVHCINRAASTGTSTRNTRSKPILHDQAPVQLDAGAQRRAQAVRARRHWRGHHRGRDRQVVRPLSLRT